MRPQFDVTAGEVNLKHVAEHQHGCQGDCDEGRRCWQINAISPEEAARRGIKLLTKEDVDRLIAETGADLAGYDPANLDTEPKLFLIERCLVYLHWVEEKRATALYALSKSDIPTAAWELAEMKSDIEDAQNNILRLKQLLNLPEKQC